MTSSNSPRDSATPAPGLSSDMRKQLEEALASAKESVGELASPRGGEDRAIAIEALDKAISRIAEVLDIEILSARTVSAPAVACVDDLKVLVVEDNPINQCVMLRMLQQFVTHIDVANHGGEAVIRAAEDGYDLIFMDCMMPIMDGFEATRKIREKGSSVAIVALTAVEKPGIRHRCIDAGMNDFMLKPMQFDALRDYLNAFVRDGIVADTASED